MDRRKVLLVLAAVIAALGVLLVFVYAKGADTRAAAQYDVVRVLVAGQQIEPGETVDEAAAAGKLTLKDLPRNAVLPGALTSTTEIVGLVASGRIYAGEQIIADKFGSESASSVLQIPDGDMAMSVQLTDPGRVAGFVSPGAEVAVFWTKADSENGGFTRMLLQRETVLAVGSTTPISTTEGEEAPTTLMTLSLDQAEAARLTYAAATGEVSFALLTPDSKSTTPAPPVGESDLFQ